MMREKHPPTKGRREIGLSLRHEQWSSVFTGYVWNSHITAQVHLIFEEELTSMLLKQFHQIEGKEMSPPQSSCLLQI